MELKMNLLLRDGQKMPDMSDWKDLSYFDENSNRMVFQASYKGLLANRIKVSTTISRKVIGLNLILRELRDVADWLDLARVKTQEFSTQQQARVTSEEDKSVVKALWRAAIITYAKPFVSGTRAAKLQQNDLRLELHQTHQKIILLRHKFVAHSDSEVLEFGEISEYKSNPLTGEQRLISINTHQSQIELQILEEFSNLVGNVLHLVTQKLGQAVEKLNNEMTQS